MSKELILKTKFSCERDGLTIKGYDGDVLIVHGTADKIVKLTYAEQAVATYKNELSA